MTPRKHRRVFFKREAKRIIFSEWLEFALATLIAVLVTVGLGTAQSAYLHLLSGRATLGAYHALYALLYVVSGLILLPLAFGYFAWCVQKYEGGKGSLSDMFRPFASAANLIRAYAVTFAFLLRGALSFFLPAAFHMLANKYLERWGVRLSHVYPPLPELIRLVSGMFALILYFAALAMTVRLVMFLYLSAADPHMPVRMCAERAKRLVKGQRGEGVTLLFSFAGWVILSLFTAGVLFVVFVLPYIILSSVSFCSYLQAKGALNLHNLEHASLTKTAVKE